MIVCMLVQEYLAVTTKPLNIQIPASWNMDGGCLLECYILWFKNQNQINATVLV